MGMKSEERHDIRHKIRGQKRSSSKCLINLKFILIKVNECPREDVVSETVSAQAQARL